MNSLDITILLIMAVSLTVSTFRGGVREIFSLAAVVAGFMLASRLYTMTSESVLRITSVPEINSGISFLAIFMFTAVLISFIGGRIAGAVKKSGLRAFDLILGTAIGAVKGILVCSLVVYALLVFMPADSAVFAKSRAFPHVVRVTELVAPIGPKFFREELEEKLSAIKSPGAAKPAKPSKPPKPEHKKAPAPKSRKNTTNI